MSEEAKSFREVMWDVQRVYGSLKLVNPNNPLLDYAEVQSYGISALTKEFDEEYTFEGVSLEEGLIKYHGDLEKALREANKIK